jgi:hypothetical protein
MRIVSKHYLSSVKKGLFIGLGIVLGLVSIPFIFLKLAFGPLHDSVQINLGTEGKLICDEVYNADFAGEFYRVKMVLETSNGRKYNVGALTFHDQDWSRQIKTTRNGDWLVITLEPENFVQIKMLNTVSGQLNDTTLLPFDLRNDLLYKERFNDRPDRLYPGSSRILDISGGIIDVSYEYKAKAAYPSEILVNQKVVYEVNTSEGTLQTIEIHDRVVQ